MNHLVPCPECSRHVRVSEAVCPFCALALDLAGTPEPRLPGVRLSRAATLAFGATLASATTLAACGGTVSPVPVYGAPAGGSTSEAGATSAGSAGTDNTAGGSLAIYGAPAAAGAANNGGSPGLIYGAPPFGEEAGSGGVPK